MDPQTTAVLAAFSQILVAFGQMELLAVLVRTVTQGIRAVLKWGGEDERKIKTLAIVVAGAFVLLFGIDVFKLVGLETKIPIASFPLSSMVIGIMSMGTHDIMDYMKVLRERARSS